jgi:hypothetical protein
MDIKKQGAPALQHRVSPPSYLEDPKEQRLTEGNGKT